jgi:hypothetical protein
MTSRIGGDSAYAHFDPENWSQSDQGSSSGTSSTRSAGSGSTGPLSFFQWSRRSRAERDPSPERGSDENSIVNYLFADLDDARTYASLQSDRTATYRNDGSTVWGVDKGEYEEVQREEGMPSLEEEHAASTSSASTYHSVRSQFSQTPSTDSRRSEKSTRTSRSKETTRRSVGGSDGNSAGSNRSASTSGSSSTSGNRWRAFQRARLADDLVARLEGASLASRETRSSTSRQSSSHAEPTPVAETTSTASGTASASWPRPRSTRSGSRASSLSRTLMERRLAERFAGSLRTLGEANRRREQQAFTERAYDVASRLESGIAYQDRRQEVLAARRERENALPSVSSGSFRSTDSEVIARLGRETSVARDPSTGPGLAADQWAVLDDRYRGRR